jgi:hypothetical protein
LPMVPLYLFLQQFDILLWPVAAAVELIPL